MDLAFSTIDWHVCEDDEAVARLLARQIVCSAREAIAQRGVFRIVLAGGRSPLAAYRILAREDCDWPHWRVYFGDERCLPADDALRNCLAARKAWLDRVPIPQECVFPIPVELGAEMAAKAYTHILENLPVFDMVLLGMGEDGHTASLFPGHQEPPGVRVLAVYNAPKPPPQRVSLSTATLSYARQVLILATGVSKRDALARWRKGESLPVAGITARERLMVLLDADAAGEWD